MKKDKYVDIKYIGLKIYVELKYTWTMSKCRKDIDKGP